MTRRLQLLLLTLMAVVPSHAGRPLTLAELTADPAKYDGQVIEISAFVSHGFENFTLLDPVSRDVPTVWVEYGGTLGSGTIYCCGVTRERGREEALHVDKVETKLVRDDQFRVFDRIIQSHTQPLVHATLRGRFFAGEESQFPGGKRWAGYGHFGLFSLFVIEQVLSVSHQEVRDVDYDVDVDFPSFDRPDCEPFPVQRFDYEEAIALQRRADAGERGWSFTHPARVAEGDLTASLARPVRIVRTVKSSPHRRVYEVVTAGTNARYLVTVSRPYWLTFYAARPDRVAWTVIGFHEAGCREL